MALLLAFVVLICVSSLPAGAVSPININNRPTPLPNAVNGAVAASRLIGVIPNCIAARAARRAWSASSRWRARRGVSLGAEECYRTLSDEVKFANQANQPGNNPACVASVSHTPSGMPVGNSMHGWGKAVDLSDFRGSLTFASPGYAFMKLVRGLGRLEPSRVRGARREQLPRTVALGVGR